MSAFGGLKFTQLGINLQAKAQAGAELQYTRIGIGDGNYSGDILAITNLVHQTMSLPISSISVSGGQARIGSALSNQDLATGFYLREIGVFAEDPDEGEILYCYANAGDTAGFIPPAGGGDVIEKEVELISTVGSASNVTAFIDKSLVFATIDFVNKAIADLINGAPGALDTLKELADAMGDDPNFAATVTNMLTELQSNKLDTSAYTAADVLTKLLSVDGEGSGLDADTVGGKHASDFTQLAAHAKEIKLPLGNVTLLIVNVNDADNYEISSCLRVVASTNITFYVNFQDAAGATQKSYIVNAQSFTPGYYHMLPVFFNGAQISLIASSSVANAVFVSASAVRR